MLAGLAGQSGLNSCPLPNGPEAKIKSKFVLYSKRLRIPRGRPHAGSLPGEPALPGHCKYWEKINQS
jgi:hypothetical protein